MLLAFSAKSEELDILMLSLTFGNVEVKNCLRNVVTLFHYIEKERAWRKENGRPEGFETLNARKPIGRLSDCNRCWWNGELTNVYHSCCWC